MADTPAQIQYDKDLANLNAQEGSARVKAKEAFDLKYPEGRPKSSPGASTSGLATATGFVFTKTMLEDLKYGVGKGQLAEVYALWTSGRETEALDMYFKSKWYSTLGNTAADRYTMKLNQKSVWDSELAAFKITQKQRLSRVGVKIDDTQLDDYLNTAFEGAFTDGQIDAMIVKSASFGTKFGGDTLTKIQNFREYADAYGISYDDKKYSRWGADLFSGKITE